MWEWLKEKMFGTLFTGVMLFVGLYVLYIIVNALGFMTG
jgi:hypothetical protein